MAEMFASHEHAARRRAYGGTAVKVGEADTCFGELIDVGSFDDLLAVAAEFAVAEVVGHDEDDIRELGGLGERSIGCRIQKKDCNENEQLCEYTLLHYWRL